MAGIDIILAPNADGMLDMQIGDDGDFVNGDQFDTAIAVLLFTDRRATAAEVALPERRRGWVGNEETPGYDMGSRLWLLDQERATREVANLASDYCREALRVLVEDGYALAVSAEAHYTGTTLECEVEITRPDGEVEKRLVDLWDNTGGRDYGD